ncbi:MAG TPA: methyltransferase [Verrucomicrobiae bacterium]|jgi:2-polyprenyl-3-methyl-5-hydroxy-6-metoxy-1,4-benzoquinol methylase
MNTHQLTAAPKTDPLEIYRYRDGLYAVDLLTAALTGLDLFTWLSKSPSNQEAICKKFEIVERPADVMLTLFTAMGFLENRAGTFHVTDIAREHLCADSTWFMGPYYASLKERPVCKDYLTVLQTGKPANWGSYKNEQEWAKAMEREDFAKQFTAAMDCRGIYLSQALAKKLDLSLHNRLLDIAGGSGIYACSLIAHHARLTAAVLEKPPVDRIAREAIAKRGLSDRVAVIACNMFSDAWPSGFDLHLISNVLHDWDEPVVRQLLAKSFQALSPGGMLIIHDVHINREKTGPYPAAAYSALLMNITEGKCYSIAEMEGFLQEAGFEQPAFCETAADRSFISARKIS